MVEIKAEISGPGAEALKEVASGGRGALRRAFGPALTEFGEMLSDQMKLWRFRNLLRIREKADRLISDRMSRIDCFKLCHLETPCARSMLPPKRTRMMFRS
jgi:hypothetical protein